MHQFLHQFRVNKQEDGETRVLSRAKSNISQDGGGFSYCIEPITIDGNIETTRIQWGEAVEGSAREILGDMESENSKEEGNQNDNSISVLRDVLHSGEMLRSDVMKKMKTEGFSEKVIRVARERLAVVVRREGHGKDHKTFWRLPNYPLMPLKHTHAHSEGLGLSEKAGHECCDLGTSALGSEEEFEV